MAARVMWKGSIRFEEFSLPVKVYAAIEDTSVHFHLLHDQDMVRIRQHMKNPDTDEVVPHDQVQKGYEVRRGEFIVLSDDELDELEPAASRDIGIEQFVPAAAVNHQWYDRPYWLGPDGEDTEDYFALAGALAKEEQVGIARWVMRKKRYVGALCAKQGYLSLVTLRHQEEVIPASQLDPPQGRKTDDREREMAGQLVDALVAKFDPEEYHDHYQERIHELIAAKREGKTVEVKELPKREEKESLVDSLQASLQALKEK